MASKKNENSSNDARKTAATRKPAAPRLHKKATPVTTTNEVVVSENEIAELAYSYWEARGYAGGSPEEDWLRAENEIRGRVFAATA